MTLEELKKIKEQTLKQVHLRYAPQVKLKPMQETEIMVCSSTGCMSCGSHKLVDNLIASVKNHGLEKLVKVTKVGCFGLCASGPIVMFKPTDIFYTAVKPEEAERIITEHVINGKILEDKVFINEDGTKATTFEEFNFYKKQKFIARKNLRLISPDHIEDYISVNGYFNLYKVLTEFKPSDVIAEVSRSGIRGRGGAGFPTGKKWEFCAKEVAKQKYVICNGDEGDPGAFMDRTILESNPHSILEGMAICGYAIGATKGVIYVRAEYKLAGEKLANAISQARKAGLLGKNIFGLGFDFDIEISLGAGAFVCGEETALITSVEGNRGEPNTKPPFPAVSGLYGCPTVINNVETWTNIPLIIEHGADWYASIGTEKSKGTKIFSLTGKVKNIGLIEAPIGATLREIIYDIGGGIPNGKKFKAIQIGGPSGGCIPSEYLDTPIDYETLTSLGSMMGSGGMIVVDEDTCMVDLAKFFLQFTCDESCGKCTPCRIGNKRLLEILTRITEGNGTMEDLNELEVLSNHIKQTSLCGLGQSSPNPVLSTLRYFKDEYIAHIKDKRCPAGVCKNLIKYKITDKCVGCGMCKRSCPVQCISGEIRSKHCIDDSKCIRCGLCASICPVKAIIKE